MKRMRWTALIVALMLLAGMLPAMAATAEEHTHRWVEIGRDEPTCTREGSATYTCRGCGEKRTETLAKTGHSYGGWKVTREATCAEAGERTRKCSVCGQTDTRQTDRLPHTWGDWTIITAATDHSAGSRSHVCQVCAVQATEDYDPEGTLRRGDRSDAVRELQVGLICYGALKGRADGRFGPATERAIMAVQQAEGLVSDGIAWPQTLARLGHRFGA